MVPSWSVTCVVVFVAGTVAGAAVVWFGAGLPLWMVRAGLACVVLGMAGIAALAGAGGHPTQSADGTIRIAVDTGPVTDATRARALKLVEDAYRGKAGNRDR